MRFAPSVPSRAQIERTPMSQKIEGLRKKIHRTIPSGGVKGFLGSQEPPPTKDNDPVDMWRLVGCFTWKDMERYEMT